MAKYSASTNGEISQREKTNMERSRKIAAQGMVLLENDGTLPLQGTDLKVAAYGNGVRRTVKGGTGSGDVYSRSVVNVQEGLEAAGLVITSNAWLDRFDSMCDEAKEVYYANVRQKLQTEGEGAIMEVFTNPYREPDAPVIEKEDLAEADVALFIVARNSGEGKDRTPSAGDYELSETEKSNLKLLTESYEKVIVVLNVGGVIDTKAFREIKGIHALLLMSQGGNIGGHALADVLTGKVAPSGHLTTTWAENYSDYPSSDAFSHMNGDIDDEYYKEGVFVGYRYFDTFGIAPAYPFGYGKTYTTFDISTKKVSVDQAIVTVDVEVKNTGDTFAGKEVVQVYYSAPAGQLVKSMQELAGYKKTKELKPGESQVLSISFAAADMASYDEQTASYLLEKGLYYIRVGAHSRATQVVAAVEVGETIVTKKLSNCLALDCEMEEICVENAVPYTYAGEAEEKERAERFVLTADAIRTEVVEYPGVPAEIPEKTGAKLTLEDVKAGTAALDEFVSQLTVEEMAELCVGTSRGGFGSASIIGAASAASPGAAGDTTSLLIEDRKVPNIVLADGPAGLRLMKRFVVDAEGNMLPELSDAQFEDLEFVTAGQEKPPMPEDAKTYYQYCTAIPIATLLAQTWDTDLIEEAGDIVGGEMEEFGITLWLAPGMNIHRNPLCGRNFEYYSEDPLVAGKCAAATTIGVQKHEGCGTTIKHFALNNQEDNRMHVNAHVSERAIREIYLKGFEIAVKTSHPLSIMTSYNLINGCHAANSYDLLTKIARTEWGFDGLVMTDWGTTGSIEMNPGQTFKYGTSSAAGCVKAGNDLTMPGSQKDVDDILAAVGAEEGMVQYPLTKGELQDCAKNILCVIMKSK